MSSEQKSLFSYFKRKENVEDPSNNSAKKSKINDNTNVTINDNSNNVINDITTNIHAVSNTELLCDTQSNINESSSLTTITTTGTNDNQKRTYPGRQLRTPYTVVNDRIQYRMRPYKCHIRSVYDRISPYYM
jgi:hypothetical protein